ncbi:MAG TPA: hypothetical protein VI814_10090 [Candidatus Limnocylindria bacterium]
MEDRIGLVFSWDPRAKSWVKERGPEDAAPPPASPIDDLAVQTYFLDPANGRWQPTILGLRARQVANDLGKAYRTAIVSGLAMVVQPQRNPRLVVEVEGSQAQQRTRMALRMIGAALVFVVLIGGGAVAANTFFGPTAADANATPTRAAAASSAPQPAAGTSSASAAPTDQATPTDTTPAGTVPTTTTTRTAPPAPAAITIVSYSTRLANGTVITYTGPNGVVRNTALDMTFRATQPNGSPAFDNLTIFVGPLGSAQALTIQANTSGLYETSLKVTLPKGDQLLSVQFGRNGEVRTLGTISVR